MNVENKARDLLSTMTAGTVIKKVLGPDVARPQPLTKQTVNSVVKVFATVSQGAEGSKRLHDVVVKADKTSIIDRLAVDSSRTSALSSADVQFRTIVGEETYNRLKRELQNDSKVTEPQAKNVLAMASSAVVESLNSELGSVGGGASGIAALLNKTSSKPVAVAPAASTRTAPNAGVGQAGVAQTETSSAMRFAPLLLLGVLTLGTIKYCSDSAKNKIVVEERAELQQALGVAQQDAETNNNKITSLESENGLAQSQIATLQSDLGTTTSELESTTAELATTTADLETTTAELETTKAELKTTANELETTIASLEAEQDVPNDVATLQDQLKSVRTVRDDAIESRSALNAQFKKTSLNYDNATRKLEILSAELAGVRTELDEARESGSALDGQLKRTSLKYDNATRKLAILEAELSAANTERDEALESGSALDEQLKRSSLKFDNATRKLAILTANLATAKTERDEALESGSALDGQLKRSSLKFDNATRKLEVLKAELATTKAERDEALESGSALDGQLKKTSLKYDNATRKLEVLGAELASVKTERDEALESGSALDDQLKRTSLKYDNATRKLAVLGAELTAVKTERDEALESVSALDGQLKRTSLKYDNATRKLEILRAEQKAADADLLKQENEDTDLAKAMSGLQEKIFRLQKSKADAANTGTALQQKVDELDVALSDATDKVASQESMLAARSDSLQKTNEALASARAEIEELTKSGANSNNTLESMEKELDAVRQLLLQEQQKYATLSAKVNDQASQAAATSEEQPSESQVTITETKVPAKVPGNEALELRDVIEQKVAEEGLVDVSVESTEGNQAVAITLGSDSLFAPGGALFTREGSRTLNKIGNILGSYPDWKIDVQGHTDSQQPASSQELSSAWASSVVTFFRLTTDIKSESLSAKGFAGTKPIADNSTEEGREQNRRVDIILKR